MTPAAVSEFFRRLSAAAPEPETELSYVNDYTLLVAVVLSAQATDVGVNKATKALFETVQTPEAMLALGEAGLKQHIRTIGLFNAKAQNVIALSRDPGARLRRQGAARPRRRWKSLPGVGRKTANVVVNVAFGEETCAVDTHVFRVANRTGLAPGKTPRAVEDGIMAVVPATLSPPCPPLADPARPLYLHGAKTALSGLSRRRSVRFSRQDAVAVMRQAL